LADVESPDELAGAAVGEPPVGKPTPVKSRSAKRKRSKIRIEIPDEVDPGAAPPEPPPRINFHLRP
jgi:hypothetical protein